MRDYLKLGLSLMMVGVIAAAILGLTFTLTKDKIDEQAIIKQNKANSSVLKAENFKIISPAGIKSMSLKLANEQDKIFEASNNGSKIGYAMVVHPRGYGGLIEVVVGVKDGKVSGISMVSHKETPGLGDAVFGEKFTSQYIGLSPKDPVEVKKDIDAITGATISSKALTKGVRTALDYYEKIEN